LQVLLGHKDFKDHEEIQDLVVLLVTQDQ